MAKSDEAFGRADKGKAGEGRRLAGLAERDKEVGEQLKRQLDDRMNLGASGVPPVATATKLGDFFHYVIDKPVSLPRQKSALLPIVNKNVETTPVSIDHDHTHAKFPLLALHL